MKIVPLKGTISTQKGTTSVQKEQRARKRNDNCSVQRNIEPEKGTTIVPFKGTTSTQKGTTIVKFLTI
jgi:hypothetical protein